ncbi:MAG: TerB family tellurite resistance protein [Ekhidna sp.]|nr:TerB family tellurite resistance protein [Ekhidna sp.]MBC6409796.1 TerB family tellurite resistance protein [Ekhidna sp.]MBC6425196.1 TerB family tellurite resistance protein [Ekhidna sp.]
MLSQEEQISILVHLSKADKVVAEEEYRLILFIADGLGLTEAKAKELIENPRPIPYLKNLPSDEKFDYLFNVIRMMKADGKIHSNEIKFCEKIAINLGYKPRVIAKLSAYIYKDPTIHSNREKLIGIADQYLSSPNGNN